MKPKLASGYDGITAKLIKASAPFISSPLAYIYAIKLCLQEYIPLD
jgi:hypothetical protein